MDEHKGNIDFLRDELIHDITDPDKIALENWNNQKKDNREFYRLIKEMKLSPEIAEKGKAMQSHILKRINAKIDKQKKQKLILRATSIAASVLLLLAFSNYYSYKEGFRSVNSQAIEMFNPLGMRSSITLPDGSKVTLNAGTTITYPSAFISKKREISIKGEAYLEVVPGERPFIVKVDDINVEVLGTQFNVKGYEEDDRIEVTLTEGKVVLSTDHKKLCSLLPGQQAYYDKQKNKLSTRQVQLEHFTSWKEGKYYFRAYTLKEIMCQLERVFNVRIHIESPQLEQLVFTGDFIRGENLDQILRVITADNRMKYRIKEDEIYIKEK